MAYMSTELSTELTNDFTLKLPSINVIALLLFDKILCLCPTHAIKYTQNTLLRLLFSRLSIIIIIIYRFSVDYGGSLKSLLWSWVFFRPHVIVAADVHAAEKAGNTT